MNYLKGIVAYIICTFAVQATSHFAVNREHYAAVTFLRPNPIFALGLAAMALQGALLTQLYSRYAGNTAGWRHGLRFGLVVGAFFVSYPALAEPAKYSVPSISTWMLVEAAAGALQFGLFGLALGGLYRPQPSPATSAASR